MRPAILTFQTLALSAAGVLAKTDSPEDVEFFEKHIRPLLIQHCYECHSADAKKLKANLSLDTRQGWESGGDSGPAIIPGKPEESLLIKAVSHVNGDLEMPPKTKLPDQDIARLREWITMGAPDPREGALDRKRDKFDLTEGRKFWAFQPVVDHPEPSVKDTNWPADSIDRFILARLEKESLKPAALAPPATLLRRVYFDLIGLPPSPQEMSEFLADPSTKAFEKVVDDLLARPEFGERWGRHWLDVARFAESSGGGRSMVFPDAWRFRDYIIRSFNNDKPFDRLIREHLAGDILPTSSLEKKNEALIGSGYLVLGPMNYELQDHELLKAEFVDEQIDTVGRTFLGMTLGCARCHDHKFDPIPTSDYYSLAGIFESTRSMGRGSAASGVTSFATTKLDVPETPERTALQKKIAGLSKQIAEFKKEEKPPADKIKKLEKERKSLSSKLKKGEPVTMAADEADQIGDAHIRIRGQVRNRGKKVPRGFLTVAMEPDRKPTIPADQSGRLQLANWIASPDHPLTARVMANRIWKHLLGEGLVRTTDNFGRTGELPSHPELLDHLALRFTKNNWSVKSLIRAIVLSKTYRQSSQVNHDLDPENRLLGRAHRKRLEGEAIRDTILVVSQQLDPTRGGLTMRKTGQYDLNYKFNTKRRSVYVPWFRNSTLDLFEVFDVANANLVVGRRTVTNLPTQALFMMNSPFIREQAGHTAKRLLAEKATIEQAYQLILSRPPTKSERLSTKSFLDGFSSDKQEEAWAQLCQTLFACLDFRFVD